MYLSQRSKIALKGVHRDLLTLVTNADSIADEEKGITVDIIEGLRDQETQSRYLKSGASKTTNSRHLTGHAFDFAVKVNGELQDKIDPYYRQQADLFKKTAKRLGYPITWGGDWGWDGMHIELSWEAYPIKKNPKTISNSKTIAAAISGIPVTVLPEIATKVGSLTDSLSFLDSKWIVLVQSVLLVGIFIFVVNERRKTIQREGV